MQRSLSKKTLQVAWSHTLCPHFLAPIDPSPTSGVFELRLQAPLAKDVPCAKRGRGPPNLQEGVLVLWCSCVLALPCRGVLG